MNTTEFPRPLCVLPGCAADAAPGCACVRCAAHCDQHCDSGCDRAAVVADLDGEPLEPTDVYDDAEIGDPGA